MSSNPSVTVRDGSGEPSAKRQKAFHYGPDIVFLQAFDKNVAHVPGVRYREVCNTIGLEFGPTTTKCIDGVKIEQVKLFQDESVVQFYAHWINERDVEAALEVQAQTEYSDTNLTLTFTALDAHIWGNHSPSFSMWERPKPPYQTCFNLADVFGNFTSFTYKQLNGTDPEVGKTASRLVKIWPLEDRRESDGLPWYGFSCQDNGTAFGIPGGIKSFFIMDRAAPNNEDQDHCWIWARDGRSAASTNFKGCFAAMTAAVLSAIILVL
ncbi:hypothetical protein KCU85_g9217, partial [Aureobasidium melanogenum]